MALSVVRYFLASQAFMQINVAMITVALSGGCSDSTFSGKTPANKGERSYERASAGEGDAAGEDVDHAGDDALGSTTATSTSTETSTTTSASTSTTTTTSVQTLTCDVDRYDSVGLISVPKDVIDINSASELAAISDLHRYRLTSDITLSGTWVPLNAKRFQLDGGGHSIRGLNINVPDGNGTTSYHNAAALFAHLDGAAIVNLKIISPTVTARFGAGVIAGSMKRSCVENIEITGANISATYQAGVIAGSANYGHVSLHKVTAQVTLLQGPDAHAVRQTIGAAGSIGGLIGETLMGGGGPNSITQTTLQFDLTADTPVATSGIGVFVGTNQDSALLIKDSTATGTMRCISATCYRGGRYTGFLSSTGTPTPILQNSTVTLTKTGSWDNFKDN